MRGQHTHDRDDVADLQLRLRGRLDQLALAADFLDVEFDRKLLVDLLQWPPGQVLVLHANSTYDDVTGRKHRLPPPRGLFPLKLDRLRREIDRECAGK